MATVSATLTGTSTTLTVGLSGATGTVTYQWEASADVIFSSTTIVDTDATFDYSSYYSTVNTTTYIRPVVTYTPTGGAATTYSDIAVIKVYLVSGATRIDITFGSDIESIGNSAFMFCSSLANVVIGDSVTSIGQQAFIACSSLANIDFGSVTSIGNTAFYKCSSLARLVIGDSVTSIGIDAFFDCRSLATITVSSGNTTFFTDDKSILYQITDATNQKVTAVLCPPATTITNITIDTVTKNVTTEPVYTVTSISYSVYQDCTSLVSVVIGDSVTSIGQYAFFGCSSLASVVIGDSVTSIGSSAFDNCTSLANIYFLGANPYIDDYNFQGKPYDTAYYRATYDTNGNSWGTIPTIISYLRHIPTISTINATTITGSCDSNLTAVLVYISSDDGLTWTTSTITNSSSESWSLSYTFETGKTYKVSTIANYYNATPDYSIYCKTLDLQSPTLQITSDKSLIKSGETATLTFTFSETVTGFDSSDVTTSNGTLGTLSGSGTTYTAIFTPTTNYRGTATINIADGKFSDAAGNENIYTALSINILVNVTFRVDVSNVTESFTGVFLNGTFNGWCGSCNPMTNLGNGIWEITISLAAGSYEYKFTLDGWNSSETFTSDSPGTVTTGGFTNRGITVGDSDIVLDAVGFGLSTPLEKIPPTVDITSDKSLIKSGETATITFTFSEAVTGFSQEDVTTTNGTLSNFAGSGTTYTAIFTPTANVEGTATINIAANKFSDATGNPNTATSLSITVDTLAPNTPAVTGTASNTISGTAEAGSTLVATNTNNVPESVSVDNTGKWRLKVASIDSYVFRARDTAGNISNPTTFSSSSFSFRYSGSSTPYRFTAGSPIKSIGMSSAGRISGDTSTSFKIKSALPPGLSFSRRTGRITGTPLAPLAATKYTITSVSTVYPSRSAKITIEVL